MLIILAHNHNIIDSILLYSGGHFKIDLQEMNTNCGSHTNNESIILHYIYINNIIMLQIATSDHFEDYTLDKITITVDMGSLLYIGSTTLHQKVIYKS